MTDISENHPILQAHTPNTLPGWCHLFLRPQTLSLPYVESSCKHHSQPLEFPASHWGAPQALTQLSLGSKSLSSSADQPFLSCSWSPQPFQFPSQRLGILQDLSLQWGTSSAPVSEASTGANSSVSLAVAIPTVPPSSWCSTMLTIQAPQPPTSPTFPFLSGLTILCVCAKSLQLCPVLCNLMDCSPPGFSVHGILHEYWGQEYWSGLPCLPPGDLPDPGIEPASLMSPAFADGFFTTSATWEAPTIPLPELISIAPLPPKLSCSDIQKYVLWYTAFFTFSNLLHHTFPPCSKWIAFCGWIPHPSH